MSARTIWKFELSNVRTTISMPADAKVLAVQMQGGELNPFMWVMVLPTNEMVEREFLVAGTGHDLPAERLEYIDTIQVGGGRLVFHVFEIKPRQPL